MREAGVSLHLPSCALSYPDCRMMITQRERSPMPAKKTATPCASCGTPDVEARDPASYPYCRSCHYTGAASEHQRATQIDRFKAAFPDASFVGVEHTGGGCFWLAFRWDGDPKYYIATDGEASLPSVQGVGTPDFQPMPTGGWGYVGRQDDSEDEANPDFEGTPILQPIIDGEDSWTSERYWAEYPKHCLSDEQIIEAIRADRATREGRTDEERPSEAPYEVLLGNGDRATAPDIDTALYAARHLCQDAAPWLGGARALSKTISIYCEGRFDGLATALALARSL